MMRPNNHVKLFCSDEFGLQQVVLEGFRLNGSQGYMAWDDLSVLRGPCPLPATCDFEDGLCDWMDVPDANNNNWVWLKAELATNGVEVDHTTGTGDGKSLVVALVYIIHGQR